MLELILTLLSRISHHQFALASRLSPLDSRLPPPNPHPLLSPRLWNCMPSAPHPHHPNPPQVMKDFAADSSLVHLIPLDSVRHAGATLAEQSWAVLTTKDGAELIYLNSLCQYNGCIKKDADSYSYEHGHVMLQCFSFTFKQLRVEAAGNRLSFKVDRLVQLLQYHREREACANSMAFPFVLTCGDMPYGTWSWHVKSLFDVVSSKYKLRPIHWSGALGDGEARKMAFTYR